MEEMGFDQEKARVALEMTNGNMVIINHPIYSSYK
jgi:hypothetical protein